MDAVTTTLVPSTARKPLSTSGLIRVCVENGMEFVRGGARSNIAGPRYKIVQSVAAHISGEQETTVEDLAELEFTLSTCLEFVRHARVKRMQTRD